MPFDELEWVRVEAEFLELGGGEIWDRVEEMSWRWLNNCRERECIEQRERRRNPIFGKQMRAAAGVIRARYRATHWAVRGCKQCRKPFSLNRLQHLTDVRFCSKSCASAWMHGQRDAPTYIGKLVTIGGVTKSIKQWCQDNGISYALYWHRRRHNGMSIVEALSPRVRRAGAQERAKQAGISVTTARWRISQGWSEEAAWTTPAIAHKNRKLSPHTVLVTIGDETRTVRQWLLHVKMSRVTYLDRIRRGMSPEQAITTPRRLCS